MSLTFRGQELQQELLTGGIWLDLTQGYAEPAEVRGEDDVVPEAAGRDLGQRTKDVRVIVLEGSVKGIGADTEARTAAWRSATDALMAVMQLDDAPGELIIGGGYLGIEGSKMLTARCVRVIPGPIKGHMSYQPWSFQLECVDSPPEWVDGGS